MRIMWRGNMDGSYFPEILGGVRFFYGTTEEPK
jgi:hypothetical protein